MPPAQWTTTRFSNGCATTGADGFEGSRQAARLFFDYSVVISAAGLDPNRDPNTEKSRWIQADTVDRPPSRKHAKAPESVAEQRFPARIVSSHAGGHWFESSSLHQKIPDFVRNQEFFLFMYSNSDAAFWLFCLTQTLTQKPRGQESTGEGRMASSAPLPLFFVVTSPD